MSATWLTRGVVVRTTVGRMGGMASPKIIYRKYLQWRGTSPSNGLIGTEYHLRHTPSNQSRNNVLELLFARCRRHLPQPAAEPVTRASTASISNSIVVVGVRLGSRPTAVAYWERGNGEGRRWRYDDKGRNEDGPEDCSYEINRTRWVSRAAWRHRPVCHLAFAVVVRSFDPAWTPLTLPHHLLERQDTWDKQKQCRY